MRKLREFPKAVDMLLNLFILLNLSAIYISQYF